jgi:hypothetical protein
MAARTNDECVFSLGKMESAMLHLACATVVRGASVFLHLRVPLFLGDLLRFSSSSLAVELFLMLLYALNISSCPKTKSLAADAQRLWWSQPAAFKPPL